MKIIVGFLLLFLGMVDTSSATAKEYVIALIQADVNPERRYTMKCADDANSVCKQQLHMAVDGNVMTVTVLATLKPGTAYLGFITDNGKLAVDGEPYVQIAIGDTPSRMTQFALSYGSGRPTSLYQLPIIRLPPSIALLRIQISPQ